jgi:quercetin dioxygenase-like cupin family protein
VNPENLIALAAGSPLRGDVLNIFGDRILTKISGAETSGAFALMEDLSPPRGGTPLHVHHREDEGFYILEGHYLFEVSGERQEAHSGDFFWVRREVPHRFLNIGAEAGRMLITVSPAGLEVFFEELAVATAGRPRPGDRGSDLPEVWTGAARPAATG